MRQAWVLRPLLWLLLCAAQGAAHAHPALGDGSALWSGVFSLLTAPLALAVLMALAAFLSAGGLVPALRAVLLAAAAAGLCARYPAGLMTSALPWACALLGLAAALALRPRAVLAWPLALVAGAAAGTATALELPSRDAALGVVLALGYVLVCATLGLHALRAHPRWGEPTTIGCRVVGAWVAAMGLLLAALALKAAVR
ncbi:MAG: hypothetical protein ACKVOO_11850 [Burkholderiaceae bacterium]